MDVLHLVFLYVVWFGSEVIAVEKQRWLEGDGSLGTEAWLHLSAGLLSF